ncbi:MAG: hypothetical protein RIS35_1541 [Pseudomonadota bacterium]|jgi:hypothetical protein
MTVRVARALLPMIAVLTAGCVQSWTTEQPVTPSTYGASLARIPRTVGMLRRLAVLPISQDLPAICREGTDDRPAISAPGGIAGDLVRRIRDEKGYEVLPLDAALYRAWLESPENQPFLEEITRWSVSTGEGARVGALTGELLSRLAEGKAFDGLLILHVRRRCQMASDTLRGLRGVMTLGLNEMWPDADMLTPYLEYRASILEAASGRPVWRGLVRLMPRPTQAPHAGAPAASYPMLYPTVDKLFEGLEPAIPKLLTR